MSMQAERIFVNLPVKDLQKSIDFFRNSDLNLTRSLQMKMPLA